MTLILYHLRRQRTSANICVAVFFIPIFAGCAGANYKI
nr:MAG TPA: putative sulfate-binding lipoprotein [Caudoviricetes sp.]